MQLFECVSTTGHFLIPTLFLFTNKKTLFQNNKKATFEYIKMASTKLLRECKKSTLYSQKEIYCQYIKEQELPFCKNWEQHATSCCLSPSTARSVACVDKSDVTVAMSGNNSDNLNLMKRYFLQCFLA